MVTALGFGVGATSAHSFKMNMARRNFRAGSPHLNQVRKEDTIDSMLSLSLTLVWLAFQNTLFLQGGVPVELKTKRRDLFEGNTLVHSMRLALTRRRKLKEKYCKLHLSFQSHLCIRAVKDGIQKTSGKMRPDTGRTEMSWLPVDFGLKKNNNSGSWNLTFLRIIIRTPKISIIVIEIWSLKVRRQTKQPD